MADLRMDGKQMALLAAAALVLGSIAAFGIRRMVETERHRHRLIRSAGPESMDFPPPDWDAVDEQSDESFPASDPPGNY